jgi:hypothetical protein
MPDGRRTAAESGVRVAAVGTGAPGEPEADKAGHASLRHQAVPQAWQEISENKGRAYLSEPSPRHHAIVSKPRLGDRFHGTRRPRQGAPPDSFSWFSYMAEPSVPQIVKSMHHISSTAKRVPIRWSRVPAAVLVVAAIEAVLGLAWYAKIFIAPQYEHALFMQEFDADELVMISEQLLRIEGALHLIRPQPYMR